MVNKQNNEKKNLLIERRKTKLNQVDRKATEINTARTMVSKKAPHYTIAFFHGFTSLYISILLQNILWSGRMKDLQLEHAA